MTLTNYYYNLYYIIQCELARFLYHIMLQVSQLKYNLFKTPSQVLVLQQFKR